MSDAFTDLLTGKSPLERMRLIAANPRLRPHVHAAVFAGRRQHPSPPFHADLINRFHSRNPKDINMVFRGGAKSSLTEEALIIAAICREFHNCTVISSNETRAMDRVIAVKHELENNPAIEYVFGITPGAKWSDSELVLSNGVKIQALGQGQDIRGTKYLNWRPDFIVVDDLEKRDDALTPERRDAMRRWFLGELVPATDPLARYRVNGTPLEDDSLVCALSRLPEWRTLKVPIKFRDENTGEWRSTWPDRFPLAFIDALEDEYRALGAHDLFLREYMCEVTSAEAKLFQRQYFRFENHIRGHEAVTAFYDPARTVKKTSAHTGKVVTSWRGSKLLIWESAGQLWTPADIVSDMFDVDARYNPIYVGVEKDGLEEFILQPLRQEGVKRRQLLTVKELKAPQGKIDFIRGLQPFFRAGEAIMVGGYEAHKTLCEQLLSFPSGRVDVPNALAYVIRNRPGAPVYDAFSDENVQDISTIPRTPFFLAVQAHASRVAGVLVQMHNGQIRVLGDWIMDGEPSVILSDIVTAARLVAGGRPADLFAPPSNFSQYDSIGLRAAARSIPVALSQGADPQRGRPVIAAALRERRRGEPLLVVSPDAHWALKAFAGGYAYKLARDGSTAEPEPNHYAMLMQALECLTGTSRARSVDDEEPGRFTTTPDGRRYRTTRD